MSFARAARAHPPKGIIVSRVEIVLPPRDDYLVARGLRGERVALEHAL